MIELLGWFGLIFSFLSMIYHRYMYAYHDQVYAYIRKKYGDGGDNDMNFPSKADHSRNVRQYSYYTIFFASLLIILNLLR
ncbi:hypothetical protein [Nitrosomonas aestuarii]|uniref:hypothetical protein n=1 Tax=Nitrosomonas aestuarii TaxID=52441 RepID=UPI000D321802|nr:hypothetical protein [Nitrosomonas aestuarii]PTN12566.1 hypothetical protein C8R11_103134 [Nitrosomonas aestuarii]